MFGPMDLSARRVLAAARKEMHMSLGLRERMGLGGRMLATLCLLACGTACCAEVAPEMIARITAAAPEKASAAPAKPRKILIYTNSIGFYHGSIPVAAKALEIVGKKTGAFEAVTTDDPAAFEPENLKQYDLVFQDSCTGEMLQSKACSELHKQVSDLNRKLNDKKNPPAADVQADLKKQIATLNKQVSEAVAAGKVQEEKYKQSLLDFVKSGKGLAGAHAATDCYYTWKEYGAMIGGYFSGHPYNKIKVRNDDPTSPINAAFEGKGFDFADEMYVFGPKGQDGQTYSREKQRVLLSIDPVNTPNFDPKLGKRDDADYAISWIKTYGAGRVFYCSFGHNPETWTKPAILKHYLDGIQYALGDLNADATPKPLGK